MINFIGDIHGKVDAVETALKLDGTVIFVGDINDSFEYEPLEHAKCFDLILDAIDDGKARCVLGNHELSYMHHHMRCSGHNLSRRAIQMARQDRIDELFEHFILLEDEEQPILVTHAGLTLPLFEHLELNVDTLKDDLTGLCLNPHSPLFWIGPGRGGYDPTGGIFWCDWRMEFDIVPGLTQIFGHSRPRQDEQTDIRRLGDNWNIDCLDHQDEYLALDDGYLRVCSLGLGPR